MKPANTKILRIKVTWHTIDQMTSLDIDIYLIYFLSKALLHHIYNPISICEKKLYIA